ncbi:MAG: HAMP domain-containing histidine kinase [Vicinamibacteria bacterium]|nr:HAMP domain-containing histidine kinase [Vicinamibacteria bacterium]
MSGLGLRGRLLLVVVAAGAGLLLAAAGAREWVARRAGEQALRAALEARLDGLDRERCESGRHPFFDRGPLHGPGFGPPADFGRPLHGPRGGLHRAMLFEMHAYARDFTPTTAGPLLPAAVREALAAGSPWAVTAGAEAPRGLVGAMPTAWNSGPCAFVALSLPAPPALVPSPAFGLAALGLLLALGGVVALAAGSTVERIRALAREVEKAAAHRYAATVTVEGGDEIAELAASFNQAAATVRAHVEEVEARERALRGFVANTTHDVGVPLSALAGHLSELRDARQRGATVDAGRLDAAAREAHYIGALLKNLGAAARLETGEALRDAAIVDIGALVERVALRHAVLARAAGVELNHAVPEAAVRVRGDVTLLEQAADNLVHNAIRYNRAGGHVALVLEARVGRFALRVSDDGPGVAEAELPRLAESRFRGGEARTRRPEGSGLGLAIASEAATLHGFTLSLGNADGGGFEAVLAGPTAPAAD